MKEKPLVEWFSHFKFSFQIFPLARLKCKSIFFSSCYRKARKSFNQIKCENVFKTYTQEGKNVMRFHWQWLWHAFVANFMFIFSNSRVEYFFHTLWKYKEESESQVQRVSLLGTLVDFIWISCTFSFLSLLLQNTIFTSIHSHFNEHTATLREGKNGERRRKNQITRKNVIKILLFSQCDLYSFTFLTPPPVYSFIPTSHEYIKIYKKIENIFQNKCVMEIPLRCLLVDRINLNIFLFIENVSSGMEWGAMCGCQNKWI